MNDRQMLAALEEEIPALEEKLRAMRATRRRLKAAEAMRAKWRDKEFRQAAKAATARHNADPVERARFAAVRNQNNPLPFPKGTPARLRYIAFRRKGWTRDMAVGKVSAEIGARA